MATLAEYKTIALAQASDGWAVFQLKPGSKEPLPGTRGHLDATTDPDTIKKWWSDRPDCGVGLACEASRRLVVDIDVGDGKTGDAQWRAVVAELGLTSGDLATRTHNTCHLGQQLVFDAGNQEINPRGQLPVGELTNTNIDIKWRGYIVAPGVIITECRRACDGAEHPAYAVQQPPLSVLPLPNKLRARITKQKRVYHTSPDIEITPELTRWGLAEWQRRMRELFKIQHGAGRNDALNKLAFWAGQLRARGVLLEAGDRAEDLIFQALGKHWPPAERDLDLDTATIERGYTAGLATPLEPWPPLTDGRRTVANLLRGDSGLFKAFVAPLPPVVTPMNGHKVTTSPETNGHKATPVLLMDVPHSFWDATPVLRHIYNYAFGKMTAPKAVLLSTLARMIANVGPHVVLPDIIGDYGSLNLFVVLVAGTGRGKTAANRAARNALILPNDNGAYESPLGTGEGIPTAFVTREKARNNEPSWLRRHSYWHLYTVSELATVKVTKNRSGAMLTSVLRTAWDGDLLGATTRDPEARLPVAADTYRLCLIACGQPTACSVLLDSQERALGTPQRFLCARSIDASLIADPPASPPPLQWLDAERAAALHGPPPQHEPGTHRLLNSPAHRRVVMSLPGHVETLIKDTYLAGLQGVLDSDNLDSHALFLRERVAGALALLHGSLDITDLYWDLSEIVMTDSNTVWDEVMSVNSRRQDGAAVAEAVKQGRLKSIKKQAEAEVSEELNGQHSVETRDRILSVLEEKGQMSNRELTRSLSPKQLKTKKPALEELVDEDLVDEVETSRGKAYRLHVS